jgi:hypothetical protein
MLLNDIQLLAFRPFNTMGFFKLCILVVPLLRLVQQQNQLPVNV